MGKSKFQIVDQLVGGSDKDRGSGSHARGRATPIGVQQG
jgi:hypothetical protein